MTTSAIDLPTVTAADLADAPPSERIGSILLAAGMSRRFDNGNKLLAEIDGKTLVRHATESVLASPVDEVIVVVGYDEHMVREALSGLNVAFVTNNDYEAGQSTSVRAGVAAACERDWSAAIFALGDMPNVSPESIERLVRAYTANYGSILAVAYNHKRGNPTLFDAVHFDALARIEDDTGGRELIIKSDNAALVETNDPGVMYDVDYRDDLDRFN